MPPPAPGLSGTGAGKLLSVLPPGEFQVHFTLPGGPDASPALLKAYSAGPFWTNQVGDDPAGTYPVSLAGAEAAPWPTGVTQHGAAVHDARQACCVSLHEFAVHGRPSSQSRGAPPPQTPFVHTVLTTQNSAPVHGVPFAGAGS